MAEKLNSSPQQQNAVAPSKGATSEQALQQLNEANAKLEEELEDLRNLGIEKSNDELDRILEEGRRNSKKAEEEAERKLRVLNDNSEELNRQIAEFNSYDARFGTPHEVPTISAEEDEPEKKSNVEPKVETKIESKDDPKDEPKEEPPFKPRKEEKPSQKDDFKADPKEEPLANPDRVKNDKIREIEENSAKLDAQMKELEALGVVSPKDEPKPLAVSEAKDEPKSVAKAEEHPERLADYDTRTRERFDKFMQIVKPVVEKMRKDEEAKAAPVKPAIAEPTKIEQTVAKPTKAESARVKPEKAEPQIKIPDFLKNYMKTEPEAAPVSKLAVKAETKTEAKPVTKPDTKAEAGAKTKAKPEPDDEMYVATRAEVNQKSLESMISSMANDALKRYDEEVNKHFKENKPKANLALKLAKIAGLAGGAAAIFITGGFAWVGYASIAGFTGVAAKNKIRQTKQYQDFRNVATEAIESTGNLDAAEAAIELTRERMVKKVEKGSKFAGWFKALNSKKERAKSVDEVGLSFEAGKGSEKYLLQRAKDYNAGEISRSAINSKAGETTEANDEASVEKIENIKGAFRDFVFEISQTKDKDALAAAKARLREQIKSFDEEEEEYTNDYDDDYYDDKKEVERNKFATDDYDELADRMIKNMSGRFIGKDMSDEAQMEAANNFIDEKLKVNIAKMNAGLDVPEKIALSQRFASMHPGLWGLTVGSLVGLVPEAIRMGRSKVTSSEFVTKKLNTLTAIAKNVAKVGITTGFAAALAYITTHRSAKFDVAHRTAMGALGKNRDAEGKAKKGQIDYDRLNVDEATAYMEAFYADLNSDEVPLAEKLAIVDDSIDLLARINAKRNLQNTENVNLFESEGWEGVARGKAEMARAQGKLERLLRDLYPKEGFKEKYKEVYSAVQDEVSKEVAETKSALKKEIRRKAIKSAAIAGSVALAMSTLMTVASGKGWLQKAEEWRKGVKEDIKNRVKGLFAASATNGMGGNTPASAAGKSSIQQGESGSGTENEGGESGDGGEGQPAVNGADQGSGNTPRESVLFEKDPNGGYMVAIDENGDGVIGEGDRILVGEGIQSGFDPTNPDQVATVNKILGAHGLEMTITQTENIGQAEITVADKLNNSGNAINVSITNNLSDETRDLATLHSHAREITNNIGNSGTGKLFEVRIDGDYPEGTQFVVDPDGDGPCMPQAYDIVDHKAVIPEEVVNKATGEIEGYYAAGQVDKTTGQFARFAFETGKSMLDGSEVIKTSVSNVVYNVSIVDQATGAEVSAFRLGDTVERVGGTSLAAAEAMAATDSAAETLQQAEYGEAVHTEAHIVEDTTREPIKLSNGETISRIKIEGDYYNSEIDNSVYDRNSGDWRFAENDYKWDLNENGRLDNSELPGLLRNMYESTAQNVPMMVQNADVLGILGNRDLMAEHVFGGSYEEMDAFYQSIGITDGNPDTVLEVDMFKHGIVGSKYFGSFANFTLDTTADAIEKVSSVDMLKVSDRTAMSYDGDGYRIVKPHSTRTAFVLRDENGENLFAGGAIGRKMAEEGRLVVQLFECYYQSGGVPTPPPGDTPTPPPKDTPTPPPKDTPTPPPKDTPTPPPKDTPTPPPKDTPTPPPKDTPTPTPPPNTPTPPPNTPTPPPNTPTPTPPPNTPTPTPTLIPKDEVHMQNVDNAIVNEGIPEAYNLDVDEVKVEHLDADSGNTFEDSDGLSGDIVTNETAQKAAENTVPGTPSTVLEEVSAENDYSHNIATPTITPIVLPDEDAEKAASDLARVREVEAAETKKSWLDWIADHASGNTGDGQ